MTIPLPKIEGFQPIPNSVMVPFMELQSAALAYAFGLNYEFGKRKIKSMDNETFNSLSSEQIANMSSTHTSVLLEEFIKGTQKVLPAQTAIFTAYVEIEKKKVIQNIELAKWIISEGLDLAIGDVNRGGTDIIDQNPETLPPSTGESPIISYDQDEDGNVTTTTPPPSLRQTWTTQQVYDAVTMIHNQEAYTQLFNENNWTNFGTATVVRRATEIPPTSLVATAKQLTSAGVITYMRIIGFYTGVNTKFTLQGIRQ